MQVKLYLNEKHWSFWHRRHFLPATYQYSCVLSQSLNVGQVLSQFTAWLASLRSLTLSYLWWRWKKKNTQCGFFQYMFLLSLTRALVNSGSLSSVKHYHCSFPNRTMQLRCFAFTLQWIVFLYCSLATIARRGHMKIQWTMRFLYVTQVLGT